MLPNNVVGTYNVFEASRQAGVRRVVYASSGSVVSGWEREEPYRTLVAGDPEAAPESWEMLTHETPLRPAGLYGCTKAWGEALARHYADSTDLSVICLRIGAVNVEDRPQQPRHRSVYCSQQNIARLVADGQHPASEDTAQKERQDEGRNGNDAPGRSHAAYLISSFLGLGRRKRRVWALFLVACRAVSVGNADSPLPLPPHGPIIPTCSALLVCPSSFSSWCWRSLSSGRSGCRRSVAP